MPDVTGHTPSKKFYLISPQKICPKVLGIIKIFFWQMWDEPLCYFWSAVAFSLELSHGCRFLPSIFLFVESWTLTLIEASEACSSFRCCSDCGSLESQSLRNGFITLPDWYMSTILFLICSWISLDRNMMCCSLSMLHFVWQVPFKWFLDSTGLAVIRPGFGQWNLTPLSKMWLITVLSWFNNYFFT